MDITNKDLKRRIIDISYKKKLSHIGSALTAVDIIEGIFKMKKADEKFVLSSGHAGLALYVVLEKYGGKNAEQIFDHHGVHPDRCDTCGISVSTGSLGHGIGIALGMALADRTKNVYCLVSDGECAEGSVWEALRIAHDNKIDNLKVYANWNYVTAYDQSSSWALEHLELFKIDTPEVNIKETNFKLLKSIIKEPQEAHYKVMNEEEYKQILELLS